MIRVLLVEDNPADVLLMREAIRTSTVAGDVIIAYDGEQALRMLEEGTPAPDLILLDLNLPRCGGLELLQRYPPNRHSAPVVVFTSSHVPEERARAMALGASDFVVKPVIWDEYFDAIRSAVERWVSAHPA
jgi:CheY-like chemotaxis protein